MSGKGITQKGKKAVAGGASMAKKAESRREEGGAARMSEDTLKAGAPKATAKGENHPTITVNQDGNGDFLTFGEALKAANPGTTIKAEYGTYNESLVIEKDGITIQGTRDVTLVSSDGDTVRFNAGTGTIKNLKLVYEGEGSRLYTVNIARGKLLLEGCDIVGNKATNTIWIGKDANPTIRNNEIHQGRVGINLSSDSLGGLIEHNLIYNNDICGIGQSPDSTPLMRRNKIFNCAVGVQFSVVSKGVLENNHIYDNWTGISLLEHAAPTIRDNSVYSNVCGIAVGMQGMGTIEDNHIFDNEEEGILVEHDATPTVRRNMVHNCLTGIMLKGGGIIAENDVHDNWQSGIEILCGSNHAVLFNRVYDNYKAMYEDDCEECAIENGCSMGDFCTGMEDLEDCLDEAGCF